MKRRHAPPGAALAAGLLGAACLAGPAAAQPAAASAARNAKSPPARTAAARPAGATAASAAAATTAYRERFATLCAACHGADGRSDAEGTPALAGQHGLYAITQLFLYREGRRDNAAMTAVAQTFTDDDLRGFSAVIDTLPAVPAPAPKTPTDPARMAKGAELAQQHKCLFCHGTDLAGGQQVPRIAGQREDYLLATLRGFKTGQRHGYTRAMAEALGPVPIEDLDALAYYAARLRGGR